MDLANTSSRPKSLAPRALSQKQLEGVKIIALEEEKRKYRRAKIVEEILATEADYVNNLTCLRQKFCFPLISCKNQYSELNIIFSNINILLLVHQKLLHSLRIRLNQYNDEHKHEARLGDIIEKIIPYMRVYTVYVNQFDTTCAKIRILFKENAEFAALLESCEAGTFKGHLGFKSLLITPIQRLPRYILLFRDLLSKTPEDQAEEYQSLKRACESIETVTELLDERKNQVENTAKLKEISSNLAGDRKKLRESIAPGEEKDHHWELRRMVITPAVCAHCGEVTHVLWKKRAYNCTACKLVCHEGCKNAMPRNCGEESPLTLIQPSRVFIREGKLKHTKIVLTSSSSKSHTPRECLLLLFNNALAVIYPATNSSGSPELGTMIRWYSRTTRREAVVTDASETSFSVLATREDESHIFYTASEPEKKQWLADIIQQIEQWKTSLIATRVMNDTSIGTHRQITETDPMPKIKRALTARDKRSAINEEKLTLQTDKPKMEDSGLDFTPSQLHFTVSHAIPISRMEKGHGTTTAYVINVREPGGEPRMLVKRYRHFYDLGAKLREVYPKNMLPQVPRRNRFNTSKDKYLITQRCCKLEQYLNALVKLEDIDKVECFQRFLQTSLVQQSSIKKKALSATFSSNSPPTPMNSPTLTTSTDSSSTSSLSQSTNSLPVSSRSRSGSSPMARRGTTKGQEDLDEKVDEEVAQTFERISKDGFHKDNDSSSDDEASSSMMEESTKEEKKSKKELFTKVKVRVSFDAEQADEMTVHAGECFNTVSEDINSDPDWIYLISKDGKRRGHVPRSHVRIFSKQLSLSQLTMCK